MDDRDARRRMNRAMIGIVPSLVVVSLDNTTVATALPAIIADLGDLRFLPYVITAYMLTSTVTLPLYGRWSDRLGRKPLFLSAQAVFLIGALLASSATTAEALIGYRAIQGAGAGGLMVLAQAIVGDTVSARDRGRYLGLLGALFAVGSVAGPIVGGFVTQLFGWRAVFLVVVPAAAIALSASFFLLPDSLHRQTINPDIFGSTLFVIALTSFVALLSLGGVAFSWASPTAAGMMALVILGVIAIVMVERRRSGGIIPIDLIRRPGIAAALVVALVSGATIFGLIIFPPVFVQSALGQTPAVSGAMLVPLMVAFMASSVITGRIVSCWGRYRPFPILGTALIGASFLALSTMDAYTPLPRLGAYLAVGGIGVGMVMQVVVLAVQNTASAEEIGTATSTAQLARAVGGVIGLAAFGALLTARLVTELEAIDPSVLGVAAFDIILRPDLVTGLSEDGRRAVADAVAGAVTTVFGVSVPVTGIAFAAALRLPDLRLDGRTNA